MWSESTHTDALSPNDAKLLDMLRGFAAHWDPARKRIPEDWPASRCDEALAAALGGLLAAIFRNLSTPLLIAPPGAGMIAADEACVLAALNACRRGDSSHALWLLAPLLLAHCERGVVALICVRAALTAAETRLTGVLNNRHPAERLMAWRPAAE